MNLAQKPDIDRLLPDRATRIFIATCAISLSALVGCNETTADSEQTDKTVAIPAVAQLQVTTEVIQTYADFKAPSGRGRKIFLDQIVTVDCFAEANNEERRWYHIITPERMYNFYAPANDFEPSNNSQLTLAEIPACFND